MSRQQTDNPDPPGQKPKAQPSENIAGEDVATPTPDMSNAELVQLHIRVIALENLVIALLANASDQQLALAREMAAYIAPRPGFTPHTLTTRAAAEMLHMVERSGHFRDCPKD